MCGGGCTKPLPCPRIPQGMPETYWQVSVSPEHCIWRNDGPCPVRTCEAMLGAENHACMLESTHISIQDGDRKEENHSGFKEGTKESVCGRNS